MVKVFESKKSSPKLFENHYYKWPRYPVKLPIEASPYLGVTFVKKLVKRAKTASKPEFQAKIAIFK